LDLVQESAPPSPHHQPEATLLDNAPNEQDELEARRHLPWWKRPSPVWHEIHSIPLALQS
jgi:hypothetical protein